MSPTKALSASLDEDDLAPGLRVTRKPLSVEVKLSPRWQPPNPWLRGGLLVGAMALPGLLASCLHSTRWQWAAFIIGGIWPVALIRGSARGQCSVTVTGWVWHSGLRWRFEGLPMRWGVSRVDPPSVVGVEVVQQFPKELTDEPTWLIRLCYRLPGRSRQHGAVLIEHLPSEAIARALVAEFSRVYRSDPSLGELKELVPKLPGVDLRSEPTQLRVAWGGGEQVMTVNEERLTIRSRDDGAREIDVDEIADVSLVPSPRRGNNDLVVQLKRGGFAVVIGVNDPPGLAARVVGDVRRLLRLPEAKALMA